MSVIYSEAYAHGSIHYDNFILILIIIQTMIDMIMEVQEYIINKDVFDSRTIRYLYESYGIDYYNLGKKTAKMAAKILKGEASPEDMPIEYLDAAKCELQVNEEIAKELGIDVSGLDIGK